MVRATMLTFAALSTASSATKPSFGVATKYAPVTVLYLT